MKAARIDRYGGADVISVVADADCVGPGYIEYAGAQNRC